jgi:hypothetical protein
MTLAWFPSDELDAAIDRWPDLLPGWDGSLVSYNRMIETNLHELAREGAGPLSISPVRLAEFLAWCDSEGVDADESSRARYAAVVAVRGGAIPWPPGRNGECWCGSHQKYKWCCGRLK